MSPQIRILAGDVTATAHLDDSLTAQAIYDALPLSGPVHTWGDEIYFDIPVFMEEAPDARAEVKVGELGYWPVGNAFCIFFGPTPVSADNRPRAYSPVNVFGRIAGDTSIFKAVTDGTEITVEAYAD